MAATLFDSLFNESAAPVLGDLFGGGAETWEASDDRVTVINLTTRETFEGLFVGHDVMADTTSGLKNIVKSHLRVPLSVTRMAQEHKLLILHSDGAREEYTVEAFGQRDGAYRKAILVQAIQTRTRQGITL